MSVRNLLDDIREFINSSPKSGKMKDTVRRHLESLRDDLLGAKSPEIIAAKIKDIPILKYLKRLENRIKNITYDSWDSFNSSTRMIYARLIDSISDLNSNGLIGDSIHNTLMGDLQSLYKGKGDFSVDALQNKISEFKINISEILEDLK